MFAQDEREIGLDVFDAAKRLLNGRVDIYCWIVRSEDFVTEDPDSTVVEGKADLVGYLTGTLAVNQFDGIGIIVLLESRNVLLGVPGEPAGCNDYPAFGAVEVERDNGRVELLDDWSPDCSRELALNDNRPTGTIDDLRHQYVSTLVGRSFSLANVLVAEIAEHILHQILKLESNEFVQGNFGMAE